MIIGTYIHWNVQYIYILIIKRVCTLLLLLCKAKRSVEQGSTACCMYPRFTFARRELRHSNSQMLCAAFVLRTQRLEATASRWGALRVYSRHSKSTSDNAVLSSSGEHRFRSSRFPAVFCTRSIGSNPGEISNRVLAAIWSLARQDLRCKGSIDSRSVWMGRSLCFERAHIDCFQSM